MGEKMHERALGDLQLEVVALRAELARVQGAVRLLAEALELEIVVEGGGILGPRAVARILAALDAPAPDAAPEPMPDVWWGACDCGAAGFWTPGTVRYVNCPKCFGPRTKGAPAPGLDAAMAAVAKAKAAASGSYAELRPTPPADAPLPGQVADAVMVSATGPLSAEDYAAIRDVADAARRRMASAASAEMQRDGLLLPLPPEVESALAVIRKASDAGLFDAKPETSRALAAWARAQQQPALGADVREAMREAAAMLHHVGSASYIGVDRDDAVAIAARLRELAGEP